MAQRTQVSLIDDIDGSSATETVRFAVDGKDYVIDVSGRNANGLRKAFAPYVAAGRKLTNPKRGRGRPYRHVETDVDPASVRAWAVANDYEISTRGRVSAAIIEEYRAAGN